MHAKRRYRLGPLLLAALAAAALAAPAARAADTRYEGIAADGSVAFFSTVDSLVPGDTDSRRDVYARAFDPGAEGYVTREASLGPAGGNNAYDVQFLASDPAGERVFFSTQERLTAADEDNATDIYVRDLSENKTTLVSAESASCPSGGCDSLDQDAGAVPGGVVAGGDRVFFASAQRLAPADTDGAADVYVRDLVAGTTTLVSLGEVACAPGCGNGADPAFFQGAATADGATAFFTTSEALVAADSDGLVDIYERDLEAGETRIVSTPGTCPAEVDCTPVFGAAAADGSHAFFETKERIAGEDEDDSQDVYDYSGGEATLASRGPSGFNGSFNALFAGRSADGEEVFFATNEQLDASADSDSSQDVYVRSEGATTALVSAGEAACAPGCGNADGAPAALRWVAADGATALFSTAEPLAEADGDAAQDVYRRDLPGGTTALVSQADPSCSLPECGSTEVDTNFAGAAGDASHVFLVTTERLIDADADSQTDVYDRSGGATTLVSTGSINGNGPYSAQLQGVSGDGGRAFLVTKERLTEEDDFAGEEDVYSRGTGATLLVSRANDSELESKLAPPAPALEATDPVSPGSSTEPRILGSESEAAASIKLYETADCSGEPVAVGGAEELAEPGIAVTVPADSTTSFRATAEAEGFVSPCSAPLSYTHESPPPPEEEGGGEEGGGEETGGGEEGGGSAEEGGSGGSSGGESGSSTPTDGGLAYVAPVTRITFGPAFKTRARRPAFRFIDATGQPGTRFVCRVDRRRWQRCNSPVRLRRLQRGRHVFRVKAVNAVGFWERRPSSRAFKMLRGDSRKGSRRGKRHVRRARR